ncbi:alpha-amylase family glycosyl hydrolase [Haliangium sp.]|uniref:alpha-amylase family glycosyl hydrolase n=1 Tax=Haliangium sp. TaxID=2663208 RepID=UPI003D0A9831
MYTRVGSSTPAGRLARTAATGLSIIGLTSLLWSCAPEELPGVFDDADKAAANWYFRGTPNGWSTTAMSAVAGTSRYETCQQFSGDPDPRFKIDHFGDWSESYPGEDYRVDDGQSYHIVFDEDSQSVSVEPVAECDDTPVEDAWHFRGTPNDWGTTAMEAVAGTNSFRTCQDFVGDDDPRFKIDHFGDWSENYPGSDYRVAGGIYEISFDADAKAVTAQAVTSCGDTPPPPSDTWYFRGTPNGWDTTAMDVGASAGLYTTTVAFAGEDPSPRFKIDRFGDWTESYPTADVIVADCFEYEIVFDSASKQITPNQLAPVTTGTCGDQPPPPPPPPPPSGADFREETIYFLLTTRFYDGDPDNNYYNRDRIKLGDPQWRGDFKGLIEQLDYIAELGFTAIWITPPVENRSGLDYHGYHAYDWNRIDPRLESADADYQALIDAAHARGIKIIQDVVINHSSQYGIRGEVWIDHLPIKYYRPAGGGAIDNGPYQGNLGDYLSPFRDDNDNPVAPAWFRDRHSSDADGVVPLVDPLTGVTVPSPGYNPNRFFGIDANTLDPDWYHLDGFMAGGDWENPTSLWNKHLAGDTIDLATENQNVKDYLNNAIFRYLDMGVDAIRLDTVKHMERDNLLEYVDAWRAHKPSLFVFGENLVKGTGLGSELANDNASAVIRPWWYTRRTPDPSNPLAGPDSGFSVLDFSLFSTFRDNVRHGNYGGIGGVLSWDWIYGDATKLVTFLQNHDVGPDNDFKYRYQGDTWMAAITYNLLWTMRGIPALYYGEEIEFMKGAPQDIDGANMTIDQTGRAYFGDHLEPGAIAQTKAHPLWSHIQRLNLIRRSVPALQKGQMLQVNEFGSGMSFVRDYNGGESYAVVGLATGFGQNFSVSGVRNGTYRDAVTGNVVTVSGGTLSFSVRAHSAGIYVLDGPGKIGQDGAFLR